MADFENLFFVKSSCVNNRNDYDREVIYDENEYICDENELNGNLNKLKKKSEPSKIYNKKVRNYQQHMISIVIEYSK